MVTTTRSGRSSKTPLNRDQAVVPLIGRREELGEGSHDSQLVVAGVSTAADNGGHLPNVSSNTAGNSSSENGGLTTTGDNAGPLANNSVPNVNTNTSGNRNTSGNGGLTTTGNDAGPLPNNSVPNVNSNASPNTTSGNDGLPTTGDNAGPLPNISVHNVNLNTSAINTSGNGGSTPAMDTQLGDAEDGVGADKQSVPITDVIDLTTDEPSNVAERGVNNQDGGNQDGVINGRGLYDDDDDDDDQDDFATGEGKYQPMTAPELSNDIFQLLLDTLNSGGIVYTSPKGKEKLVTSERMVRVPATSYDDADDPMDGSPLSEPVPSSYLEARTPISLFSEQPKSEQGSSVVAPALLVSAHRPGLRDLDTYEHAVFRAKEHEEHTPLTARYVYQLLRSSDDLDLEDVNRLVDRMLPDAIRLATARSPVFMNDKMLYRHPLSGFRHLGYLEQLDKESNARDKIEPVIDCPEKRRLLGLNGLDETLDMYVLYIWTDDHSTALSSMTVARNQNVVASLSAAAEGDDLIPEEYQRYFTKLVGVRQNRDTAFSMFIHVRIVTEICEKLGIPCITGVHINERHLVGDRLLCVSDIINKLGHRKPGTFNNHRGSVHLARLCLEHLEVYGIPDGSAMATFHRQVKELLQTPLHSAHTLVPGRYGSMKEFNNRVRSIAFGLGIKRKQVDTKLSSGSE